MNVYPVWCQGYTGRDVVVSILDDGIEKDHPDIKKNYARITDSLFLPLSNILFSKHCVLVIVHSTKVLCPENLFPRKSQRNKGRMSNYVDIQHLCCRHRHLLSVLLTKSWFHWCKQNKPCVKLLAINILHYFVIKEVKNGIGSKSTAGLLSIIDS